jgi:hypothetical protein
MQGFHTRSIKLTSDIVDAMKYECLDGFGVQPNNTCESKFKGPSSTDRGYWRR